jgi:hypothetical protein
MKPWVWARLRRNIDCFPGPCDARHRPMLEFVKKKNPMPAAFLRWNQTLNVSWPMPEICAPGESSKFKPDCHSCRV